MNRKLLMEQYGMEVELFKLILAYYKENGLEMTEKVVSKALETIKKKYTPNRAPQEKNPHMNFVGESKKRKKKESKEGAGGYDAPAYSMEPDHVHFKKVKNRF